MAEFVYVDNSNVFIEGKRVSAVKAGLSLNIHEAIEHRILDSGYRLDFGKLHNFVAGDDPKEIKRAVLFGSRPPANDSLWDIAKRAGFETVVVDRNAANKEKKVDTAIVAMMTKDAYKHVDAKKDTITLVAGDGDFVPALQELRADGFRIEIVFWGHASKELKRNCDKFINLDSYLGLLQH